jgi:LysR family nitrogen assimilation transcriptional regulator
VFARPELEAFLEVVQARSIQAAATHSGRSRATYHRALNTLEEDLGTELLRRGPGQRQAELTPAGEALAIRARALLERWDQGLANLHDALGQPRGVRVGAMVGAFDLLADLILELLAQDPLMPLRLKELPGAALQDHVLRGDVDLGFGTADPAGPPKGLRFTPLGPLPFAVILPAAQAPLFPAALRLSDLDEVPMVVHRAGPAREHLEREFAAAGALTLVPLVEVESTPRLVDMVARGFGPAVVSRVRLSFLPEGVVARPLLDGPQPLRAGVYMRRGARLSGPAKLLVTRARARFQALAEAPFPR